MLGTKTTQGDPTCVTFCLDRDKLKFTFPSVTGIAVPWRAHSCRNQPRREWSEQGFEVRGLCVAV